MAQPIVDGERNTVDPGHREKTVTTNVATATSFGSNNGAVTGSNSVKRRGFLGTLLCYEEALDRKLGVEKHAITRKRPEDRDPSYKAWHKQAMMFVLWLGSTSNLSCFATGFLGLATGLDLTRTLLLITFGTLLSSAVSVSTRSRNVEYPSNTPSLKVFLLTMFGMSFPTVFGMSLGALAVSAVGGNPAWSEAKERGLGFLVQEMLHPYGLAKTLLVILAFACIGMVSISFCCSGLAVQQMARPLAHMPRFVWVFCMYVAVTLLGIVGRDKLVEFLQNFLALLGYWVTAYFVIIFTEHYVFRRGINGYDFENWNTPDRLPRGWAAAIALLFGIFGALLGMGQKWYVSIFAAKINGGGSSLGDVGNLMAFLFTLVVCIPFRWLEYDVDGR